MPSMLERFRIWRNPLDLALSKEINLMENWIIRSVIGTRAASLLIDEGIEVRHLLKEKYSNHYSLGQLNVGYEAGPAITMSIMRYKSSMSIVGFDWAIIFHLNCSVLRKDPKEFKENGSNVLESKRVLEALNC